MSANIAAGRVSVPDSGKPASLALALIASSPTPLLLVNGDLVVIAASQSFCEVFHIDPASVAGCPLARLGAGEWGLSQVASLLRATASGFAEVEGYEMDLPRGELAPLRLSLSVRKLDYEGRTDVRTLLTVRDITADRTAGKLHDNLLREKDILLKELHHRVANSLQIIASVLLQSARKVQSDESRKHLHDAHHRVMSVAALQKQLALSRLGDVELRPYFTVLCDSIGAAMIGDHHALVLEVQADESITTADTSVSLGLIVTELVINALKHAFPGQRSGKIAVAYRTKGADWTLSVADDGVGMPAENAKAGLGTSIVEALARQLAAGVTVADAHPGTIVSIAHTHVPVFSASVTPARPAV